MLKSVHVNGNGAVQFSREELDLAGKFFESADRRVVSGDDRSG